MENEQCQAVAELLNTSFAFIKPLSLKCAIDLGILDAISCHGRPITLNKLLLILSIPPSKTPYLRRLMRTLTHFGFIYTRHDYDKEATYDLTPTSRLVTNNNNKNDGSHNLLPFLLFLVEAFSDVHFKAFLCMGEWFRQGDGKQMPFEVAHGCSLWDLAAQNSKLNDMFNGAMVCTSSIFTDMIIKSGADIFKGVDSLVDVGGGTGALAKAIATYFPHVKCTVLDLPHVVHDAADDGIVKFLPGDMFSYVPPANAVLLKWILHCWSDEDCIKILKQCKAAVSSTSTKPGGKVIIMDAVVGSSKSSASTETQLMLDMLMMTIFTGTERDEHEWGSLFKRAGFSSYNIKHTSGFASIIEVDP